MIQSVWCRLTSHQGTFRRLYRVVTSAWLTHHHLLHFVLDKVCEWDFLFCSGVLFPEPSTPVVCGRLTDPWPPSFMSQSWFLNRIQCNSCLRALGHHKVSTRAALILHLTIKLLVVSTPGSQQEGPRFDPQSRQRVFLCGVSMFSPCLRRCPLKRVPGRTRVTLIGPQWVLPG